MLVKIANTAYINNNKKPKIRVNNYNRKGNGREVFELYWVSSLVCYNYPGARFSHETHRERGSEKFIGSGREKCQMWHFNKKALTGCRTRAGS